MPAIEDRLAVLEKWMKATDPRLLRALNIANALEGRPSDATLSLPHNDSWLFEDNVDGTHPANLRYVIAANTQKIVSARLTIHLAPYRTYSNFSVTATGTESAGHTHAHSATHQHTMFDIGGAPGATTNTAWFSDTNTNPIVFATPNVGNTSPMSTDFRAPGTSNGESATHTHAVSGSSFLGVSEGVTASAVTISFDGVDQTAALGGPFNSDQIELNVRPYLGTSLGVLHTVAMQPSGLGRIEAHLRLGVYVSAGQLV